MKQILKPADIIIILIAAVITFFAAYIVYIKPQGILHNMLQVLIRAEEGEWTFPVNAEETIIVSGPLGNTVVRLHENSAWIESSPCDNQTCMAAGLITRHGQWTACLPNNILLMIQGIKTEENNVDAISW